MKDEAGRGGRKKKQGGRGVPSGGSLGLEMIKGMDEKKSIPTQQRF